MTDDTNAAKAETPKEDIKILPPDYSLKKIVGENVDINQILNEEVVEKAQQSIDKHKDSFYEWAINDVKQLDEHYKKASEDVVGCEPEIANIEQVADRLKSRAGTFDYGLGTQVAKSLSNFCLKHPVPDFDKLVVIRKHIDTLSVIFNKKITGDGGSVGKELLENLIKLVAKYN